MTSIDKMSIRGIRSFSPNETQVIEFFKPLTLIVGKNGSGKTTTIECLKMGTTGDLPPNCRSGQAFINDPNVFNSSEVKAQIKLKFTTATGKPAVCTRSFSLVQKPQRKEYKAFEAALQTIDENGDKTSLSYKSADLNKLVPEMMHVSTAVLDSVIFVHQEDSCWPLAEDKVLKQRFDDIFAATNYTKALDAIKAYRLDKSKDIKVLAAELETLETKLTQANRLRTELQQSQVDKDSLVEQIDKAKDAVQKGRDRLPALRAEKEKGEAARAAYERAANEHNHAMQAAEESNQSLERTFGGPLEETDEELREIETAQQSARIKMMADMDSIKGQAASMEAEIEQAERARDSATGMLEQQRAQEAHHKKVEEEAQTAATEMEQRYLSKGDSAGRQPTQTPIAYVQEVAEALARVLSNRQSELRDSKEERQRLTQTKGAEVQQLRIKLEHSAEQASAKEREASALQAKARQLEERLETGAQAGQEATLTRVRQEVKDLKGQLSAADEDLRGSTLRDDLASSKHRKRTVKDKLQALAEELVGIEREGDKQQRLQRHKEVVAEKRAKLESAIGERRPRLHGLIDVPLADDVLRMLEQNTLVSSLSRKKNQREEEASEKEGEVQAALDKAQKKSYDVHAKQEQLRELQCKHNEEEERVRQADPAMLQEHYDGSVKLHQLEEALVEKQEALTGEEGLLTTMIKAKDRALSHGKCLVCAQTVGDDQKNKIDDKIKRIQAMLAAGPQKKDEVTEAEEKLAKHKRMAELGEVVKKRRLNELPAMEQMFEQAKSEHAALKRELEGAQRAAAEQKQLAVGARDLLRDVDHLRYLHKEWQEALGEVASIQSGMQSGMHAVYRPRDAVVAEQDESNAELERLEKAIEKDDAGLRRKESELSELRTRSSAKELECNKLAADVERRKDAEAQLAEVGFSPRGCSRRGGVAPMRGVGARRRAPASRPFVHTVEPRTPSRSRPSLDLSPVPPPRPCAFAGALADGRPPADGQAHVRAERAAAAGALYQGGRAQGGRGAPGRRRQAWRRQGGRVRQGPGEAHRLPHAAPRRRVVVAQAADERLRVARGDGAAGGEGEARGAQEEPAEGVGDQREAAGAGEAAHADDGQPREPQARGQGARPARAGREAARRYASRRPGGADGGARDEQDHARQPDRRNGTQQARGLALDRADDDQGLRDAARRQDLPKNRPGAPREAHRAQDGPDGRRRPQPVLQGAQRGAYALPRDQDGRRQQGGHRAVE